MAFPQAFLVFPGYLQNNGQPVTGAGGGFALPTVPGVSSVVQQAQQIPNIVSTSAQAAVAQIQSIVHSVASTVSSVVSGAQLSASAVPLQSSQQNSPKSRNIKEDPFFSKFQQLASTNNQSSRVVYVNHNYASDGPNGSRLFPFQSLSAAFDSITDATSDNPYVIQIDSTGKIEEKGDSIQVKPNVFLRAIHPAVFELVTPLQFVNNDDYVSINPPAQDVSGDSSDSDNDDPSDLSDLPVDPVDAADPADPSAPENPSDPSDPSNSVNPTPPINPLSPSSDPSSPSDPSASSSAATSPDSSSSTNNSVSASSSSASTNSISSSSVSAASTTTNAVGPSPSNGSSSTQGSASSSNSSSSSSSSGQSFASNTASTTNSDSSSSTATSATTGTATNGPASALGTTSSSTGSGTPTPTPTPVVPSPGIPSVLPPTTTSTTTSTSTSTSTPAPSSPSSSSSSSSSFTSSSPSSSSSSSNVSSGSSSDSTGSAAAASSASSTDSSSTSDSNSTSSGSTTDPATGTTTKSKGKKKKNKKNKNKKQKKKDLSDVDFFGIEGFSITGPFSLDTSNLTNSSKFIFENVVFGDEFKAKSHTAANNAIFRGCTFQKGYVSKGLNANLHDSQFQPYGNIVFDSSQSHPSATDFHFCFVDAPIRVYQKEDDSAVTVNSFLSSFNQIVEVDGSQAFFNSNLSLSNISCVNGGTINDGRADSLSLEDEEQSRSRDLTSTSSASGSDSSSSSSSSSTDSSVSFVPEGFFNTLQIVFGDYFTKPLPVIGPKPNVTTAVVFETKDIAFGDLFPKVSKVNLNGAFACRVMGISRPTRLLVNVTRNGTVKLGGTWALQFPLVTGNNYISYKVVDTITNDDKAKNTARTLSYSVTAKLDNPAQFDFQEGEVCNLSVVVLYSS